MIWDHLWAGIQQLGVSYWLLIGLNLLLMAFAPVVVRLLGGEARGLSVHIFLALNLLILLILLFSKILLPLIGHSSLTRLIAVLVALYIFYLLFHVLAWFIKRRFGRQREIEGREVWVETYNSRVLTLLAGVLIAIIGIIGVVQILGYTSLLQAGGVIGFIGVLLALTQGAWAPDIIGGLVILNSRLFEEGDVVELGEAGDLLGVVFKTKVFHSELLDLANQHRIVIGNARIRGMIVRNHSRFASARGLRESLSFKIGYEVPPERVEILFERVFARAVADDAIAIEAQHGHETLPREAGDHAIEWCFYYFTKDSRSILTNRQRILRLVIEEAADQGIGLATPILLEAVGGSAPIRHLAPTGGS